MAQQQQQFWQQLQQKHLQGVVHLCWLALDKHLLRQGRLPHVLLRWELAWQRPHLLQQQVPGKHQSKTR